MTEVVFKYDGGDFRVDRAVASRASDTISRHLLTSSTVELRGGVFDRTSVEHLKNFLNAGANDTAAICEINRCSTDDEFMAFARVADELTIGSLTAAFSTTLNCLSRDVDRVRGRFGIAMEDDDSDKDDDATLMTRSTIIVDSKKYTSTVLITKQNSSDDSKCRLCATFFGIVERRHHCRSCGYAVCGKCSTYQALPKGYTPTQPQSYSTLICNLGDTSKHLICSACRFSLDMGSIDIDVSRLRTLARVSAKWRHAAINYGREMLDAQYRLPYTDASLREQRRLWTYRDTLVGHSRWTLQVLKCAIGADAEMDAFIAKARSPTRVADCHDLLCSGMCTLDIDGEDALELLSGRITRGQVRVFAVECLERVGDERLLCYLPTLVNDLIYEPSPPASALWAFLLRKAFSGPPSRQSTPSPSPQGDPQPPRPHVHSEFCNQLYWALHVLEDGDRRFLSLQQRLLIEISRMFGDRYALSLVAGLDFVNIVNAAPSGVDDSALVYYFEKNLRATVESPIRLPINPNVVMTALISVKTLNSSTHPILMTCRLQDGGVYRLLYKREDLRRDWVVVNVLRVMADILPDVTLLTYRVLPTGRDSGFIEVVPDSITLYDIEHTLGTTLQKYILTKCPDDTVSRIKHRFTSSLAGYSLASYVLALGDRHKNNIMVSPEGMLFHIDYGYILGRDAALKSSISPYMRITPDMRDVIGEGVDDARFQQLCVDGLKTLRRHVNIFVTLLMFLVEATPRITGESPEQIQSIISSRFKPDRTVADAASALSDAIERSKNSSGGRLVDTFHRLGQTGRTIKFTQWFSWGS